MKLQNKVYILLLTIGLFSCNSEIEDNNSINSTESSKKTEIQHKHYQNSVTEFYSYNEKELLAITDLDKESNFKHYYLIQSENEFNTKMFLKEKYQIFFEESYLIFKGSNKNIIFSIDKKNKERFLSKNDIYVSVFGISKRHSGDEPLNLNKVFAGNGGLGSGSGSGGTLTCHSGGVGSTECSTEGGAPMSGNCSVKCSTGYYACCDDTRNECKCKPIPTD